MSQLERILRQIPAARERKNKNRAIGKVIEIKYGLKIPLNTLEKIAKDVTSLDREWRKILEQNPDLRGNDYHKKGKLEEKKLKELGYR